MFANFQEIFVAIAVLLAILGNIPYIRDILNGKVKPHPFTWFVWSIVSCITFFGALQKGGGLGTIPILASEIFTIIIFLLAIKIFFTQKTNSQVQKTDYIYLVICLLGLIPWYLTSDPTISVIVAVTVDVVAFIPTLGKTHRLPRSENYILFLSNFVRHMLILATLDNYNIATSLHSIAMIITNITMVYLIKFHKHKWF